MDDYKVSIFQTISVAVVTFTLITLTIILNISLVFAFAGAILFTSLVLMKSGYKIRNLIYIMYEGVKGCKSVFIIIILMGATISTWLSSGVVPSIIYYGFNYVKGANFVVVAFIFTLMMAYVMGTALGTISTVGIAMLAIGKGLMIPTPVLLGAVISGAFIADKMAPISSLNNLTLEVTNTEYMDYVKSAVKTLIPTIILSTIVYYILGNTYGSGGDMTKVYEYQNLIKSSMVVSPYLLFFPLLVIILAFLGVKAAYNMSMGVIMASIVTVLVQKISILTLVKSILWGYKSQTGMAELDALVSGGGVVQMLEVVFIIVGSVALSSLFERGNLLKPLIDSLFKENDDRFALITKTSILSIILTAATCDQTAGIIIPVKVTLEKFEKIKVDKSVLARTVADTGTIVAPLMPWNVNAVIINSIIGVSAIQYAPFAVLCFINPIVMILIEIISSKRAKFIIEEVA